MVLGIVLCKFKLKVFDIVWWLFGYFYEKGL